MKKLVSTILLLFVAASVVYMVVSEVGSQAPGDDSVTQKTTEAVAYDAADQTPSAGPADPQVQHKVIAFYFHGDRRCRTCLTMETYAREALETSFPDALRDGRLEWRAVNTDKPENSHFTSDYELTSSAVVLVDFVDGEQRTWRSLQRIWDLVSSEAKFKSYVTGETSGLLESDS